MLDIIRGTLLALLFVLSLAMWGRLILDYSRFFAPTWRPKGLLLVLCEGVYSVTDPPIKLVRKVLPPIKLGGVALDLAWMVVMFGIGILQSIVSLYVR